MKESHQDNSNHYLIAISLLIYKKFRGFMFRKLHLDTPSKPMMKYEGIEVIKEIINNLNPKKCLEWGSRYSTLFFPKLLPKGSY